MAAVSGSLRQPAAGTAAVAAAVAVATMATADAAAAFCAENMGVEGMPRDRACSMPCASRPEIPMWLNV